VTTATAVREHPILFSGPMVQAIKGNRKTQTRREITRVAGIGKVTEFQESSTKGYDWTFRCKRMLWHDLRHDDLIKRAPHGRVGDRLWVRENWAPIPEHRPIADPHRYDGVAAFYQADGDRPMWAGKAWKPSIHMPRSVSRLTLEITNVRIERLIGISEADAHAEGCTDGGCMNCGNSSWPKQCGCDNPEPSHRQSFWRLWQTINGHDSVITDPWVWVYVFNLI
jgi:hypothetical protein